MKWCAGLVVSGDTHATAFGDHHGGGDFTRIAVAITERRTAGLSWRQLEVWI